MKRLLTILMVLTVMASTSFALWPQTIHAASLQHTIAANYYSSCDGDETYYSPETQTIVGYKDEGDGCLAYNPHHVPSQCSSSALC